MAWRHQSDYTAYWRSGYPVPLTNSFAILVVREAVQPSDLDTCMNLNVFDMFPSIACAGRRFAFLHGVRQVEFPSFRQLLPLVYRRVRTTPHFLGFSKRVRPSNVGRVCTFRFSMLA